MSDAENILANLVRIGTVSSIDSGKRRVRVIFKDRNMVSGWLYVLQHHSAGVSVKSAGGHDHDVSVGGTTSLNEGHQHSVSADGSTAAYDAHAHSANVTYWMPSVNDVVLCLYLPVDNADGFVLGAIK